VPFEEVPAAAPLEDLLEVLLVGVSPRCDSGLSELCDLRVSELCDLERPSRLSELCDPGAGARVIVGER
jgi:hypothetical protein